MVLLSDVLQMLIVDDQEQYETRRNEVDVIQKD
jgi:hypothetical protein